MDGQKNVLYVEDEPFLGKTLQRMFTEAGFQFDLAVDGDEALKKLKESKFDFVLLDILLPKIDGFEVLRQMKATPETKNVPVVVLSNLGSDDDVKKSKTLGADNHFIKVTMDPRKIVAYVKTYLGNPK